MNQAASHLASQGGVLRNHSRWKDHLGRNRTGFTSKRKGLFKARSLSLKGRQDFVGGFCTFFFLVVVFIRQIPSLVLIGVFQDWFKTSLLGEARIAIRKVSMGFAERDTL